MAGPDSRDRPAGSSGDLQKVSATSAASVADQDVLELARRHRVALGRRACRHLHTYRPCRACQQEHRAAQDELRRLFPPRPADPPSTFFLTDDALRVEANRLVALCCSVEDVEQILAIQRGSV